MSTRPKINHLTFKDLYVDAILDHGEKNISLTELYSADFVFCTGTMGELTPIVEIDGRKAPAHSGDSIVQNGKMVGTVTSADWGHRTGKNLAMGFVDPSVLKDQTGLGVEIIGDTLFLLY